MRYYIDCEFDGFRGMLISLALVREDGQSIYLIMEGAEEVTQDPWVRANVLPILRDCPEPPLVVDRIGAQTLLIDLIARDSLPHIVADWPADHFYLLELIEEPGGKMLPIPGLCLEVKRVDAYPCALPGAVQHNAWWDAVALREKIEADEEAEARLAFGTAAK